MGQSGNHNGSGIQYIIDGGMLLHTIKWAVGSTYEEICSSYYGWFSKYQKLIVVFDDYDCSTKDMCHRKRTKDSCSNITPSLDSKLSVTKAKFLSNVGNKQRFLCLLQNYLMARGSL